MSFAARRPASVKPEAAGTTNTPSDGAPRARGPAPRAPHAPPGAPPPPRPPPPCPTHRQARARPIDQTRREQRGRWRRDEEELAGQGNAEESRERRDEARAEHTL